MNYVGEQVVVPQPVLGVNLVVVDRQGSVKNASLLKIENLCDDFIFTVVFFGNREILLQ